MAQAKSLASLTPRLLARKGGARPALRPQAPELAQADTDDVATSPAVLARGKSGAKVVSLRAIRKEAPAAKPVPVNASLVRCTPAPRPAAFTLRLDAERHLRLRLATALAGRSAQQLVVEALDSMLATLPEVAEMAARAGKRR